MRTNILHFSVHNVFSLLFLSFSNPFFLSVVSYLHSPSRLHLLSHFFISVLLSISLSLSPIFFRCTPRYLSSLLSLPPAFYYVFLFIYSSSPFFSHLLLYPSILWSLSVLLLPSFLPSFLPSSSSFSLHLLPFFFPSSPSFAVYSLLYSNYFSSTPIITSFHHIISNFSPPALVTWHPFPGVFWTPLPYINPLWYQQRMIKIWYPNMILKKVLITENLKMKK